MTKKIYDLTVRVGNYTDKEGKTKGQYTKVGLILEKEDGKKFMMIDPHFNFCAIRREEGRNMVIVSMFESKNEESKPTINPEDIQWTN